MALFNYATKEVNIKIVYYGPGLSGKTTNLQFLHSVLNPATRGKLLSLATEADRTLFFDFLPVELGIELGKISDFSIRFQLYTVPGQVRYNATRKLVLKGADAVVFVADSQREMMEQNIESLKNMYDNLIANNIKPEEIPILLEYNKRDLPNILSVDELNRELNQNNKYRFTESVATEGTGVEDTFRTITKLVIKNISKKHNIKFETPEESVGAIKTEPSTEFALTSEPVSDESVAADPVFETTKYETQEVIQAQYDTHHVQKTEREPVQPLVEETISKPIEKEIIREIREVPVIPEEKIDKILNSLNEILQSLKDLKSNVSNNQSEVTALKKELRELRELKEIQVVLKDIKKSFDNIKTKKSWFRFF